MKKNLLLIICTFLLGVAGQAQNLISNGSFENDFSNWTNLAGGASSAVFSIDTTDKIDGAKAMKVAVAIAGANAYDVQSINTPWASVSGKDYTLSFYAKSNVSGKQLRAVQQVATYAQQDFTISASWQKYEWTFTAQEANLQLRFNFPVAATFLIDSVSVVAYDVPPAYVPTGPPLAAGNRRFLGSVYSASQKVNFTAYFNQVTPENDGKWGAVEAVRDVMNWQGLDSAYKLAKDNGFPFKMHNLIWGAQQPAWIESLPAAEQLAEIKQWFAAVAARYPDIDYIDVVNEPINTPPNKSDNGGGNYINALGGTGATGYDWIVTSYQLARQYFPASTRLLINEYSIVNDAARAQKYLAIVNLLKSKNLLDGVAVQAHAFSLGVASSVITANLNTMATSGLPLYASELDIDGPTDQVQLDEYKRIFPLLWEHPAIKGVTLWGYRPGHWRTAEGAYIVQSNGAERPAMVWLKQYLMNSTLPITFTSFEARKINGKIQVSWSTANEVNNGYFIVERSTDGNTYKPFITVQGNRNSRDNKAYAAYDEAPGNGLNYYRLVQYDLDGNKKYYGVRVVRFGNKAGLFVQAYPNPATTFFTLRTEPGINAIVAITNSLGLQVETFTMPGTGIKNVSVSNMPNGVYNVRLLSNGEATTTKLVVIR